MSSLSFAWSSLATLLGNKLPVEKQKHRQRAIHFVQGFSILGIVIFLIFGLINVLANNYLSGLVEFSLALVAVLNILLLHNTLKVERAASFVLLIMVITLLYLLYSGGISNTGILWFYTFPALAFFLKGKRGGVRWIALLLLLVGTSIVMNLQGTVYLPYSFVTVRQMLISFLAVSALVYIYEDMNVHSEQLIDHRNKQLQDTNRRLTESLHALEQSQLVAREKAKDEALLASIGEGLVFTDKEGRVERINDAALQLLGATATTVKGKRWSVDVPVTRDEQGHRVRAESVALCQVLSTSQLVQGVEYYQREDGTRFPAQVTAAPVKLDDSLIGAVLVFRDMSAEKKIDQMKSDFVSLVSHQLKTPVAQIKGYVDNMRRGLSGKVTKKQGEYLERMTEISNRNLILINDLLNVSSMDRGVMTVTLAPVILGEVIEAVMKDYKERLIDKKLKLVFEKTSESIVALADRDKLTESMRNVINNAIKFTDSGSITVRVEASKKTATIEVHDTGPGIEAEVLSQLFSRHQVLSGVARDKGGAGLGLYIAKRFMQAQNGDIAVVSKKSEGTSFLFTLPLASAR